MWRFAIAISAVDLVVVLRGWSFTRQSSRRTWLGQGVSRTLRDEKTNWRRFPSSSHSVSIRSYANVKGYAINDRSFWSQVWRHRPSCNPAWMPVTLRTRQTRQVHSRRRWTHRDRRASRNGGKSGIHSVMRFQSPGFSARWTWTWVSAISYDSRPMTRWIFSNRGRSHTFRPVSCREDRS